MGLKRPARKHIHYGVYDFWLVWMSDEGKVKRYSDKAQDRPN
jgi:phage/plasmid-associated DNA primase